jgi:hypothetical protein
MSDQIKCNLLKRGHILGGLAGFGPLTERASRAVFQTNKEKVSLAGKEEVGPMPDLAVIKDHPCVQVAIGNVAFLEECLKRLLKWFVMWVGGGVGERNWRGRRAGLVILRGLGPWLLVLGVKAGSGDCNRAVAVVQSLPGGVLVD